MLKELVLAVVVQYIKWLLASKEALSRFSISLCFSHDLTSFIFLTPTG